MNAFVKPLSCAVAVVAVVTVLAALPVQAAAAEALSAEVAWVRLAPPGQKNTAAFLLVRNNSVVDVKIVSVASKVARLTELHTHSHENGIMKMSQVPHVVVKAGQTVVFEPGTLHVMLIDTNTTLKDGDVVTLVFHCEDSSSFVVQAPVRASAPDPVKPAAAKTTSAPAPTSP